VKVIDWLRDNFLKNVPAWIFFGLFVVAEVGNYNHGRTITKLCELTGSHDVGTGHPRNAREEIDNICIAHDADYDWE
jgi:hypothetical protein